MLSILTIVLPIFALVFAGWAARRLNALGPHAASDLNGFVVKLALPALLFDITAHARAADVWQPGFIGAFGIGMILVFAVVLGLRRRAGPPQPDAALDGLNAGYANTGFVGFPLTLAAVGPAAAAPTLIAALMTVCVLFAIAIVLIEVGRQAETRPLRLAAKIGRLLVRNPLLVAPALGALVPMAGLAVPDVVESFLKLLGAAASPCALVSLGLFLAAGPAASARDVREAAMLVAAKLIAQPVVTWVFAVFVFGLSPTLTHIVVLLAALPTGTGPYMLAEAYRRDAGTTSRVILVSTVLSVVTISAYLAVAQG